MKTKFIIVLLLMTALGSVWAQDTSSHKIKLKNQRETTTSWSLNLLFSDNGFGLGATFYKQFSKDVSGLAGISFSGTKDDREFEQIDIYGNTYVPYKVNRLFLAQMTIGAQFRLFREDVSDNLRPFVNFGIIPTAVLYNPYSESFFPAIKYTRARYTLGGFVGFGVDYVTNRHSSLSLNVRYNYVSLFGEGINSISTQEKNFFGGVYFVFAYNFMH
jgi:hypothetical protein